MHNDADCICNVRNCWLISFSENSNRSKLTVDYLYIDPCAPIIIGVNKKMCNTDMETGGLESASHNALCFDFERHIPITRIANPYGIHIVSFYPKQQHLACLFTLDRYFDENLLSLFRILRCVYSII